MTSLSVLIPVYNYDCTSLVVSLLAQLEKTLIRYEVIVGDDSSTMDILDRQILGKFIDSGLLKVIDNGMEDLINIGAGRMRNRLANTATNEWLLFLDSDVSIISPRYVDNYIQIIDNHPCDVISGGFCYQEKKPIKAYQLKYYYGRKVECRSLSYRQRNPYTSFISMNFIVRKTVYISLPMDKNASMGYEDALWSQTLKLNKIKILHINNPVNHDIKETNRQVIDKNYLYVDNLKNYRHIYLPGTVKLLDVYRKIEKFKLNPIIYVASLLLRSSLEYLLITYPSKIKLLSILKLFRISRSIK